MCGIAGVITDRLEKVHQSAWLENQTSILNHRGPDAKGIDLFNDGGFCHTRLSIIDLAAGTQPMSSADDNFVITYNGEVYNYLELKSELQSLGRKFITSSDTEVILQGFMQWGKDVVHRLNGMFSFAIYNKREKSLFAARDPYGQKPFFYLLKNNTFYFSSEVRSFKEIEGVRIKPGAIAHYLSFESFYGDYTIYDGVKKLLHGHTLFFHNGKINTERYFHSVPEDKYSDLNDCIKNTDSLLRNAVAIGTRSDVPVSVLLSGGLDSSLVTAYFREIFPDQRIEGYHATSEDKTFNETEFAKKVAGHCNIKLNVFNLSMETLAELASELPLLLGEPQADPGIIPKHFICREIAKDYKVALTGDGGDELFYGYLIMKAQRMADYYKLMPHWFQKYFIMPVLNMMPTRYGYMSFDFLAKNFLRGFPSTDAERSLKWMCSFSKDAVSTIVKKDLEKLEEVHHGYKLVQGHYNETISPDSVSHLAYRMQQTYMPDFILKNSDRVSMLHSLELRTPLLDVELAKYVNQVHGRLKMKGLTTKYLLKRVAENHLPRDVIYRKKIGFTVPIGKVFATTLRPELEELFSEKILREQGLFDVVYIRQMLKRHFDGEENLYKPLWTLYSLQKWLLAN